jgi:SNF2 family DNA or RNA helicase
VKSGSQAYRRARPHPFAISAADLAEHCHLTGIGADSGARAEQTQVLLPSVPTAPRDSPHLIRLRPRPAPTRTVALMAWAVPVICLPVRWALTFLTDLDDDVRFGPSVAHLARLAEFACDLAERGRVLPTVDLGDEDGEHRARWRPVLQGPDLTSFQQIVAAMPPVGRAETDGPGSLRGQVPGDLLTAALASLTDAAVRERLARGGVDLWGSLPARRGRRPAHLPAPEAWLRALTAVDPVFTADRAGVDALATALAEWDDVGEGAVGPARLLLRVVEPLQPRDPADFFDPGALDGDEEPWRVEFLLQSVADPSLQIPATQVWEPPPGLERWLDRPDQLLLGELGRASAIYPALDEALHAAKPSHLALDAVQIVDFLTARAPLLEQAGFSVLLPTWWTARRAIGLGGWATSSEGGGPGAGAFDTGVLLDFRWRLAIGDQPLTDAEMEALAEAKAPLVRLRGEWVAFDPLRVRRAIEYIQAHAADAEGASISDIVALAATHPDDLDTPLPVTSIGGDGWIGALLAGEADRMLEPVPVPASLNATLRPYQERGLAWLSFLSTLGLGACLADDMGLGKTLQVLALEAFEREEVREKASRAASDPAAEAEPEATPGVPCPPSLIICPMSLVGNWQREAARFAPDLTTYAHHGPDRARGEEFAERVRGIDIVLTTYQTAVRDIDTLRQADWARVVLDEAQAVKNPASQSARTVRRLEAPHRVALTGTPVENKLADLRSVMDFLNPGLLGSRELFRERFARPIEWHGDMAAAERLRAITRPYILRRLKTDRSIISDLPEKIEMREPCYLTPEQATLYQAVLVEMLDRIENSDGIARRGLVLAAMTKLKQICNHPAQFLHAGPHSVARSGKVTRLVELVGEILAEGDKALLFTQFTEFGGILLDTLSARFGRDILFLHGQVPKKRRDEMVEAFQSDGGPPLFLLSLKAGGTGLNLTAANHVIHVDRWWNPAVENQATDRAFRIGQKRGVQVRKFVCTGTMEERIDQLIEEKKALADLVVGDGEGWLTELSTTQLRDLFALSKEAVSDE